MNRYIICFVSLILQICYVNSAYAQVRVYEDGPINEAFLSKIGGDNLILDAIPVQPPEPINERIPHQTDRLAEWIPGYWAWQTELNDFVWVSGVWRRPPPGHLWISGFWKKFEEGWVWIHGFWNRVPEPNLQYIGIAPPDSIEEEVPPAPDEGYEWNPGYWHFSFDIQEYQWVPGSWEELDSNWILVPAHYVWRPGGYLLIPPYWDWPLEERGKVYAPVTVERERRYGMAFEPTQIIEPQILMRRLYAYYPDYLFVFRHHYYFHPTFWANCGCAPPWWGWDGWWSYTWHDHWSLWWWYTHPGYPQPYWLTPELSSLIAPPNAGIISMFSRITPPPIVTPYGVVSRRELLQANSKIVKSFNPILPSDRRSRERVYNAAKPRKEIERILRPTGRQLPIDPSVRRPNIRKPVIDSTPARSVERFPEEKKFRIPTKPRIPSSQRSGIWETLQRRHGQAKDSPIYTTPPTRRPSWSPRSQGSQGRVIYQPQESNQSSPFWNPRSDGYDEPIRRPSIRRIVPGEKKERREMQQIPGQSEEVVPVQPGIVPRRQEVVPQVVPRKQEVIQQVVPRKKQVFPQIAPRRQEVVPQVVPRREEVIPQVVPRRQDIAPQVVPRKQEAVPQVVPRRQEIAPQVVPHKQEAVPQVVPRRQDIAPQVVPRKQEAVPKVVPSKKDRDDEEDKDKKEKNR